MAKLSFAIPYKLWESSVGFFYLGINAATVYTTEKYVQPAVGTVSIISGATVVGGNVSIIKSDGTTEVIFNDLQQGLTCLQ